MTKEELEKKQEKLEILTKQEKVQRLDENGNITEDVIEKSHIVYKEKTSILNCETGELKSKITILSKDYLYLEWIDNDTYIYGNLSLNPLAFEYPEQYDDIGADIRYGILKLKRDEKGNVIPMEEEIIVQNIYDEISPNNDKTVTIYSNGNLGYFDYEKKVQLTPVVLKHAVPFDTEYDGFAECSTKEQDGYLPRDAKPVNKEKDIRLLSEEQVKFLVKYQEIIDELYSVDGIYNQMTGHSYSHRKKYD